MNDGPSGPGLRLRLLLLLIVPALVRVVPDLPLRSGLGAAPSQRLDERAAEVATGFASILEAAAAVATTALSESPSAALAEARASHAVLSDRVEGVGILGPSGDFLEWEGTPPETTRCEDDVSRLEWSIHVDGVRTRLVVRKGPDPEGRSSVVGLILDTLLDDRPFVDLLPRRSLDGILLDTTFLDRRPPSAEGAAESPPTAHDADGSAPMHLVPLRSPNGVLLGMARLSAVPSEIREARGRAESRAWATLCFVLLLALLFPWRRLCRGSRGLALSLAILSLGRALLLWQEVPQRLLTRTLGGPSFYGSSAFGGLLASPADLLLTAVGIYLAALALRGWAAERRGAKLGLLSSGVGAGTVTLIAWVLIPTLPRDSRVALLERPAPLEWDERLVLWIALLLVLIGAAELWVQAARSADLTRRLGARRALPLGLVLLVLTALAGLRLQRATDRLALDQLSTEFAPQVLQQSALRRGVLVAAMNEIRDRFERNAAHWLDPHPESMAYRFWAAGPLFHSRYKSSLDFYDTNGAPMSGFAFDLPPLADDPPPSQPSGSVTVSEETISQGAIQQRLLHSQVALSRNGEPAGFVVGHALDEPDNLPFLSQPYLDALGPGPPRSGQDSFAGGLSYVLYDPRGDVEITTLEQPPAETASLKQAAAGGERVRLEAGGQPYFGLALGEPGGRVHLLLLPERTLAERAGSLVRMALLALVLAGLLAFAGSLPRGLARPALSWPQGSFFRRLLATLLVASVLPLLGFALLLRGYIERRADATLVRSATQSVHTAQRVIEDYSNDRSGDAVPEINDSILHWLRRIVGQEIHLYRNGEIQASSKRELYSSGLVPRRLLGEVHRRLVAEGLPYLVLETALGADTIPVAYAQVRTPDGAADQLVVAVPLAFAERQRARAVEAVAEMILLATCSLVLLLTVVGALLARSVARPLRELVGATGRITGGDYSARLGPATNDELGELVRGFNLMASALARQRADLESRRDYIETLLRHATMGVLSLDAAGRIVTLNPAAVRLLARVEGLDVGADLFRVLARSPGLDALSRALGTETARDGTPVEVDLAGEGGPRRFHTARVELRRGTESLGTLILVDDITDLMRSNQLAAWAEMARAIAHEIKNPLTPIQLSAEHLQRLLHDRGVSPTEEESECLSTILAQVRALHEIAGEFSTYAKLPVLAPRPTDPVAFLREVIAPYRASSPTGVVVEESYEEAPHVPIDRRVLSRAVVNLVENALDAMPGGGTLAVGVLHDRTSQQVEIWVRDTGPGIDPAVRLRLFEPYFSTKSSGTGLGLAIARRSVEAHGGTIEVGSPPGGGSTFRIRLPVPHPSEHPSGQATIIGAP